MAKLAEKEKSCNDCVRFKPDKDRIYGKCVGGWDKDGQRAVEEWTARTCPHFEAAPTKPVPKTRSEGADWARSATKEA